MCQNNSLPPASTDPTAAIAAVDRRGLPAASASANRNRPDVLAARQEDLRKGRSPCRRRAGRRKGQYVLAVALRHPSASAAAGMSATYEISGVERRPSRPNAGPAEGI